MYYPVNDGCFNEERGREKPCRLAPRSGSESTLPSSLGETAARSRSLSHVLIICVFCCKGTACCQVNVEGQAAGLIGRRGTGPGSQPVLGQKAH